MTHVESRNVAPVRNEQLDVHAHELKEVMTRMFDTHTTNRFEIDELLKHLRQSENDLHCSLVNDADGRASLTVRRYEADHALEVQEKKMGTLQRELQSLQQHREEKDRTLSKLEADLEGAVARLNQSGATSHDAEALLKQLQSLEERERHLRKLESRLISCEDLRVEGSETLKALLRDHEELGALQGHYYQNVHSQMHNNQTVADTLTAQLKEVTDKKQLLLHEKRETIDAKQRREEYYQEIVDVKGILEADLKRAQTTLQRQEQELLTYMDELVGPYAQPERLLTKLEETMMLLKAAAINLDSDFCFVGEINEKASLIPPVTMELPADVVENSTDPDEAYFQAMQPFRGLQSFCDAFKFVHAQIEEIHGPQAEHERWTLRGEEMPLDIIEPLLSALKQLVTCYDMVCPHSIVVSGSELSSFVIFLPASVFQELPSQHYHHITITSHHTDDRPRQE